jgi:hypothetical protein
VLYLLSVYLWSCAYGKNCRGINDAAGVGTSVCIACLDVFVAIDPCLPRFTSLHCCSNSSAMRAKVCGVNGCKRSGFKRRNGLASHCKQCKGQQIGKRTRPRVSLLAQWGSHKQQDPPASRSRGGQDDWEDVDDPLILFEPDNTHDSQSTHTHTHICGSVLLNHFKISITPSHRLFEMTTRMDRQTPITI